MAEAPSGISSLSRASLADVMSGMGLPSFRAGQVFRWLHAKGAQSFDEMTDLPAGLRERLAGAWRVERAEPKQVRRSADGTVKLLSELYDGSAVETVLMRYRHGDSVCVSSQVGCRMGCAFCASAGGGLVRGLSAGEMAAQVYAAAAGAGRRVSRVVLMGIGEPLDNYDSVVGFVRLICDETGYGLSGRNISLSTCGLVPGIRRLAGEKLQLALSVSLHAAGDGLRSRLMPVNNVWPTAELMAACADYQRGTGRRISFEYALIDGVNDADGDAAALAALLRPMGASPRPHVNLIQMNAVAGKHFRASRRARPFCDALVRMGVNATLRRRLGADIDAACGQLRMRSTDTGAGNLRVREEPT